MNDLNAIYFKREIHEFIRDVETGMGINEWFRIAEKVVKRPLGRRAEIQIFPRQTYSISI